MLKTLFSRPGGKQADFYSPVLMGPETLLRVASRVSTIHDVLALLAKLEPDDYTRYVTDYCTEGLRQYGDSWYYADICTVLLAAARMVAPRTYLEIGVRRGRSMAMVAAAAPEARLLGFDLWMPEYGGMPNPGPDFVRAELARLGYRGDLELHSGDSHVTVPRFLADHPDVTLDLVTVDGDHSEEGALADLRAVIPRLAVGGVLVFDDIGNSMPWLGDVFRHAVSEDGGLVATGYTELGFGVGIAVRTRAATGDRRGHAGREVLAWARSQRRLLGRYLR
jgi:predicted O-methyltransferase YrrM